MKIKLKNLIEFNSLLLKNGFNKTQLGTELNISKPYSTQIANGTRHPSPRTAKKICKVLQVEFDDIFEIVPSEKKQEGEHKKTVR
ncbi:helix-turn-helix transcriptional regulator [Paenibacillus aquistagni]|uniref:DNA-binding transcriptional regulator, XRE-family HTH domain n=1 Tax=Paenibacillus aquistagni TaxID=1852522 RepID=A0A1X7LS79_9BACL|nr:helix-turn-helix transcriptional regulator [Paenibacillus aquistagni]SMG56510.1 DNA-binding transcriptional regulator, XRE-family HTH domain [Paenibacillus aquistagni]